MLPVTYRVIAYIKRHEPTYRSRAREERRQRLRLR